MNAPLTVKEKASASFWIALLGFGAVCFGYTAMELMPTAMSPNAVFDEAFNQVRLAQQPRRVARPRCASCGASLHLAAGAG